MFVSFALEQVFSYSLPLFTRLCDGDIFNDVNPYIEDVSDGLSVGEVSAERLWGGGLLVIEEDRRGVEGHEVTSLHEKVVDVPDVGDEGAGGHQDRLNGLLDLIMEISVVLILVMLKVVIMVMKITATIMMIVMMVLMMMVLW